MIVSLSGGALANTQGPQEITRNGKLVGVLVSPEEWKRTRLAPKPGVRTMAEFFENSPLVNSGLDLTRDRSGQRSVDL